MGHIRVGTLPKTRRWREVVELLDDSPQLTGALAAALTDAADYRLARLASEESLNYAFWLLVRITSAAQRGDFGQQLDRLGLSSRPSASTLSLISDLSDKVRQRTTSDIISGDFAEIASLSLRKALLETIAERGRSFFGSSMEDIRGALRAYSPPNRFAVIAQRFFAEFFARTLKSLLDRELANHTGPGHAIRTAAQAQGFSDALDLYTREAVAITENFAIEWYSLHNWRTGHQITPEEARGFVGHALDKLRDELKEGRSPA
jgi:hypothetical protein